MGNPHPMFEVMFDFIMSVSYILIVLTLLGFSTNAPIYLDTVHYYMKVYICLFLIWRFNPFMKVTLFTELDRKIIFSAGIFMLTATILNAYLIELQDKIIHFFQNEERKIMQML